MLQNYRTIEILRLQDNIFSVFDDSSVYGVVYHFLKENHSYLFVTFHGLLIGFPTFSLLWYLSLELIRFQVFFSISFSPLEWIKLQKYIFSILMSNFCRIEWKCIKEFLIFYIDVVLTVRFDSLLSILFHSFFTSLLVRV